VAIGFARVERVSRSSGKNACCKGAYNARTIVKDDKTNIIYNFIKKGGNVYHEILLPEGVDQKFKNLPELMNAIEHIERKDNSQLLKEYVLALPDEDNVSLEMKKEMIYEFIHKNEWVKEGLAVQIDIHAPHDEEKNWHAHLLVTTRRFTKDGARLGAKARDLEPQVRGGRANTYVKSNDEINIGKLWSEIQNNVFKSHGLENRVDSIGINPQEHIGPVRMRSVLNQAIYRNEERHLANIENLSSGKKVIQKVTNHMSVFSRGDLERAVKVVPGNKLRESLVEEALTDKSLIELFDENNKSIGRFTTIDIRDEELKLLRLSGYVGDQKNILVASSLKPIEPNGLNEPNDTINKLIDHAKESLSEEQHLALSHLLLGSSGIRIMRGRAGTGKSHVLGKIVSISQRLGVNVIGLSPTHKAKGELAKCGYEQTDTIKGMLFKLYNGRFELLKNSLLVIDEAGMVGNDDYLELLRVASSFKCNVILAGDERQLSSVQRGGMFEVFSEKFGSTSLLNIKRQDSAWGKSVAMAFSEGAVRTGVGILDTHDRIISSDDKISSMETLLLDWSRSTEELENKLIIAVKNKDVDALNQGARQHLKASQYLMGKEIAVGANYYMKNDRILIKQTNKELGLTNGDLAEIIYVSKERFTIENAQGKEISFDPSKYSGFSYGYATTVFKAQGQSINDVFVLHDGFATIRNSYVALSRNIKELNLYINSGSTRDNEHLIKQLSYDPDSSSSLNYFTKKDLEKRKLESDFNAKKGIFASLVVGAVEYGLKKITEIADKNLSKTEYYNYKEPELKQEKVEDVLESTYYELEQESLAAGNDVQNQERRVVGGNSVVSNNTESNIYAKSTIKGVDNSTYLLSISNINTSINTSANKPRASTKERFYINADYKRGFIEKTDLKENWDKESEQLRNEVRFSSERIARNLLGEPNSKLSNGKTLRFGESGKIVVRINGERSGTWYDFSANKGGDIFSLVQEQRGCDFKEAAEYLKQVVGIETEGRAHLRLVEDYRSSDKITQQLKSIQASEKELQAKEMLVSKLEARAKPIGDKSVAHRYLTKIRGIECELSEDIKTAGIYQKNIDLSSDADDRQRLEVPGKYLPAIIAFARDKDGRVTGGQQILLDKSSGTKADVDIAKKSFGRIAGSFVDAGSIINIRGNTEKQQEQEKITIIAEGLETALSVKQALMNGKTNYGVNVKVICSLGISNIRNYQPSKGEKIIIAADNDGDKSNTTTTIDNAKKELEGRGAYVEIVRPATPEDFNDLLVSGKEHEIRNRFSGAINKHTAITLKDYIASNNNQPQNSIKLDKISTENLAIIQKYNLPEKDIVEAYRNSNIKGSIALDHSRKSLEFAANCYQQNKAILKEAAGIGYKDSEIDTIKAMLDMDDKDANLYCREIRDKHLEKYLDKHLTQFSKQKQSTYKIDKLKPIIVSEQKFLQETYESLKSPLDKYKYALYLNLKAGEIASKQPELVNNVFILVDNILKEYGQSEITICKDMSYSINIAQIQKELERYIAIQKQFRQPEKQAEARLNSGSPELALLEIKKEQNMLADLHGNIQYFTHDKELMEKVFLAYTQRANKDFEQLEVLAKQSLKTGLETPNTLLEKLRCTTDLETTYKTLDKAIEGHRINNQFAKFNKQINECEKPDKLLEAIAEKQAFLVKLDQNIKYPEQHEELLELSKSAKELESKQIPKKLNELVKQSLSLYSEKSVISALKNATNLEDTCQKLEIAIHSRNIDKHLLELDKQKQSSKTPVEVIGIVKQEQEFLAGLHEKIKHSDLYNNKLMYSINEAHHNIHTGNIAKLDKLVTFLEKNSNDPWVLTTLKAPDHLGLVHHNLLDKYQAKCINTVNTGLDMLDKGKSFTLDNKKFDCPTKFFDYLVKTRTHEYFPHKEVQIIQTKVMEKSKQLELSKGLELEL